MFSTTATADILTYLQWELMQSVWRILLDNEFTDAYENGIIITFPDGIQRRVFPWFFTYTADYPEKWVTFIFTQLFSFNFAEYSYAVSNILETSPALAAWYTHQKFTS